MYANWQGRMNYGFRPQARDKNLNAVFFRLPRFPTPFRKGQKLLLSLSLSGT